MQSRRGEEEKISVEELKELMNLLKKRNSYVVLPYNGKVAVALLIFTFFSFS